MTMYREYQCESCGVLFTIKEWQLSGLILCGGCAQLFNAGKLGRPPHER